MKKIRSRDELQELIRTAQQLKQQGGEVPYGQVEATVCEYYVWKLEEITHGRGTDEDVIDLVGHHWPHLTLTQEIVVDYWQARLIRHILEGRNTDMKELFIKGCTGAGKGGATAIAANLWYETGPECKVVVTSDSAHHAERVMFSEVARFRRKMKYACKAAVGAKKIHSSEAKYIQVVNPESTESFSGQHSVASLFIFDEACFDQETEILSRRGWVRHDQVGDKDEFLSLNPITGIAEFQRAESIHKAKRTGVMLQDVRRGINFCVSPHHRMLVKKKYSGDIKLVPAEKLAACDTSPRSFQWVAEDVEEYVIPECRPQRKKFPELRLKTDDWLQLLAWYISEGHTIQQKGRNYGIGVTQKCPVIRGEIMSLCQRMGLNPREHTTPTTPQVHIYSRQLAEHMALICGRGSKNKLIPSFVGELSARQIEVFLDVYRKGDGYEKAGGDVFYTSSKAVADGLQILCLKTGRNCSVNTRAGAGETVIDGHRAVSGDGYVVYRSPLSSPMKHRPRKISKVDYEGVVWCVRVPGHTVLSRRGGVVLWTGNSGVDEMLFNQAETQAKMTVALSNPRPNASWFKRGFPANEPDETRVIDIPGGKRSLITVGGMDCINVKLGRAAIPAQITRERYEAIKAKRFPPWWGTVMGDGRFSDLAADKKVIHGHWLKPHLDAWHKGIEVRCFGLDVARSESGDQSELSCGSGGGCRAIHELQSVNTMEVVGWVLNTAQSKYGIDLKKGNNAVTVDMDGLGAGAGDRLRELGVWVIEFRGNAASTADPKTYGNLRAEAYGELGRRFDPDGAFPDEPWAIPNDPELIEELCAPEKIYQSDGIRYKLTPKRKPNAAFKGETIYQRIGRSPDRGDAVAYLYHSVREGGRWEQWRRNEKAPFIASGQDPENENKILTDEEMEQLPEGVREFLKFARKYREELDEDEDW